MRFRRRMTLGRAAETFAGVAAAAFRDDPDAKFAAFEAGSVIVLVARGARGEAVRRLVRSWKRSPDA